MPGSEGLPSRVAVEVEDKHLAIDVEMRTALLPPRMELVAVGDPARPACAMLPATTLPRMEEPLSEAELMRLLEVTASCTTVGLVVAEGDIAWLSPDLA